MIPSLKPLMVVFLWRNIKGRIVDAEANIETELDVLRDVSRRLERAGIEFMLTGSVAMSYYSQPRMTRDIDLVVSLNEAQAEEFFRSFESNYYFDRRSVADAISRRRMFNLICDMEYLRSRAKRLNVDELLGGSSG